jgi:hypothetical protein
MLSGKYYRTQADLFARLAMVASDPLRAVRYNEMALEHLAKANEIEPQAAQNAPARARDDGDMNRL